jgi:hypothetical protein
MGIINTNITTDSTQTDIKCLEINLQRSRAAPANLTKIVTDDEIDIIFIQEPYTIQAKLIGIPTKYTPFMAGGARPRAAVVVTNKGIDSTRIRQLSDKDAVTVEIIKGNIKIIAASMYFDRELQIENDLEKMEWVLLHAKNTGVLIASDTNARSALWNDRVTNERGRILEDFITTKQLYCLNEESSETTFSNSIGKRNIDLTIINPQLLSSITGWEISGQESLSDHRIIKYNIKPGSSRQLAANPPLVSYRTKNESLQKFPCALLQTLKEKFKLNHKTSLELDASLSLVAEGTNVEALVDDYNDAVKRACDKTFPIQRSSRHAASHKSVPWWTTELTVLRKRTNALRRLHQRTKNDEELRTRRKKIPREQIHIRGHDQEGKM